MNKKNYIHLIIIVLFLELICVSCSNNYSSSYIKSNEAKSDKRNSFISNNSLSKINNGNEFEFCKTIPKKTKYDYSIGRYLQKIKNGALYLLSIYAIQQISLTEGAFISKLPKSGDNFKGNSLAEADQGFWVAGKNESSSLGLFAKYDESGNLELTRQLTGINEIKFITEDVFHNLDIAGTVIQSNGFNDIAFAKITSTSNYKTVSFCRSFGGMYDDDSVFIYEVPTDDSILTSGTTIMSEVDMKDAVAISIDSSLELKWANRYGDSNNNVVLSSIISNSGSPNHKLILSGYTQDDIENIFFTIVNPDTGNMESTGTEIQANRNARANSIFPIGNDNILFTGYISGLFGTKNLIAGKISNNGAGPVVWVTELSKFLDSGTGSIEGLAITEKQDDDTVIVVGHLIDFDDLSDPLGDIVICNFNSAGVLTSSNIIGGSSADLARSTFMTADNNLALFGQTSSYSDNTGFFLSELSNTGSGDCTSSVNLNETSITTDVSVATLGFSQNSISNDSLSIISCSSSEKTPSSLSISCSSSDDDEDWWESDLFLPLVIGGGVLLLCLIGLCIYMCCKRKN